MTSYLKNGTWCEKLFFQKVCQILLHNFIHDQNFIKTMLKGSKLQKSVKKWHLSEFPIEKNNVKAVLQKHD